MWRVTVQYSNRADGGAVASTLTAFSREADDGPACGVSQGSSPDFWTPANDQEKDAWRLLFETQRVWMPLKLSHNGVPLLEAKDFKKMLLRIKFASRRIQDRREWRYARSQGCPVYGATASSNGLNAFGETPRTALREFLKTLSGTCIPNVEFVGLMRAFAGLRDIGGIQPRCSRTDCVRQGHTGNPLHARVCYALASLRLSLHNRIRDLLNRLLAGVDEVLVSQIEQPYHGPDKSSDVRLTMQGGGCRHLDVSITDAASVFYNKAHTPPSRLGSPLPLPRVFDDIAKGGVQSALQTRFQTKVREYRDYLNNNNNNSPDAATALQSMSECDVQWDLADFRPIIFDSTGTLHLSSQKWLKGILGCAKWQTFAHDASDIFATFYGAILAEGARRWARSDAPASTAAASAGMRGT